MAAREYRWDEITAGTKVLWALCVILLIIVTTLVVVYGRRQQQQSVLLGVRPSIAANRTEEAGRRTAAARIEEERRAQAARAETERAAFTNYVRNDLSAIPQLRSALQGRGYIRGKIAIINRETRTLDQLHFSLPEELRATRAGEVGTVVWLDWGTELRGYYTTGGGAYRHTCAMTVIDYTLRAKIATRNFRGSEPPEVIRGYGAGYGDKPDIVAHLLNLPRR